MAAPLALIVPAALAVLSIAAQTRSANRQHNFQKNLVKDQKKADRRSALERAIGGTAFQRRPDPRTPPNLAGEGIVQGLANLGVSMSPQIFKAFENQGGGGG